MPSPSHFLPFTHTVFIASYCCTITHVVNIGCQDLGSPPHHKQEMSDTAGCLEESFLRSYVLSFNTTLVFNCNNLNNFSTSIHHLTDFNVLLTVHLIVFISVINQLDAQTFCFTVSSISCLYMFRAHVLNIRRSKLHYTASGIITPIGGRLTHTKCMYVIIP